MTDPVLLLLIFLVALIYSSVGHGGASGYLVVLAVFTTASSAQMSATALLLNLFVAGTAWQTFWQAGHGSVRLIWPFLLGSIPCALVGGWLPVSTHVYDGLLAVVLAFAAVRLMVSAAKCQTLFPHDLLQEASDTSLRRPGRTLSLLIGCVIGLVSGIVGVGGGIFLSPLMILRRWADAKQTAAVSACFIVLNSAAGLLGRVTAGQLDASLVVTFIAPALAGGVLGSRLGAGVLPNPALCRILAGVLIIAMTKRVLPWWN